VTNRFDAHFPGSKATPHLFASKIVPAQKTLVRRRIPGVPPRTLIEISVRENSVLATNILRNRNVLRNRHVMLRPEPTDIVTRWDFWFECSLVVFILRGLGSLSEVERVRLLNVGGLVLKIRLDEVLLSDVRLSDVRLGDVRLHRVEMRNRVLNRLRTHQISCKPCVPSLN